MGRFFHKKDASLIQFTMQEGMNCLLTLENREKLTLTGVESVDAFSDRSIRLTVCGEKLTIEGEKLKILAFSEGSGNFTASGEVSSLRFGKSAKKGLFA